MRKIEIIINDLLEQLNITTPPISVRKVAKELGLIIRAYDLGTGISGALLLDHGKAVIGVNPSESLERTRFTIAHEIGHYCLHKSSNDLFVDREILFRDGNSSSGELKLEREANNFAASLLMPSNILLKEIKELSSQNLSHGEDMISKLAKKFKVSTIAMTYRLTNLGILH